MALTAVNNNVNRVAFLDEQLDCIGQLQLPTLAWLNAAQGIEDLAVEKVAASSYEIRGSILRLRFLHHSDNLLDAGHIGVLNVEDSVVVGLFAVDLKCT